MRDTIDMANEAGGILLSDSEIWGLGYEFELYQLKAFEALVRADEREACAEVCDELHWPWRMGDSSGPKECAATIRARRQA